MIEDILGMIFSLVVCFFIAVGVLSTIGFALVIIGHTFKFLLGL